jgi:hypothetical protein
MKVESRNIQIFKAFRNVQRHQPSSATLNHIGPNSGRVILFEQSGQSFVAKTLDHN